VKRWMPIPDGGVIADPDWGQAPPACEIRPQQQTEEARQTPPESRRRKLDLEWSANRLLLVDQP